MNLVSRIIIAVAIFSVGFVTFIKLIFLVIEALALVVYVSFFPVVIIVVTVMLAKIPLLGVIFLTLFAILLMPVSWMFVLVVLYPNVFKQLKERIGSWTFVMYIFYAVVIIIIPISIVGAYFGIEYVIVIVFIVITFYRLMFVLPAKLIGESTRKEIKEPLPSCANDSMNEFSNDSTNEFSNDSMNKLFDMIRKKRP
jgi:hypothetical protein